MSSLTTCSGRALFVNFFKFRKLAMPILRRRIAIVNSLAEISKSLSVSGEHCGLTIEVRPNVCDVHRLKFLSETKKFVCLFLLPSGLTPPLRGIAYCLSAIISRYASTVIRTPLKRTYSLIVLLFYWLVKRCELLRTTHKAC